MLPLHILAVDDLIIDNLQTHFTSINLLSFWVLYFSSLACILLYDQQRRVSLPQAVWSHHRVKTKGLLFSYGMFGISVVDQVIKSKYLNILEVWVYFLIYLSKNCFYFIIWFWIWPLKNKAFLLSKLASL